MGPQTTMVDDTPLCQDYVPGTGTAVAEILPMIAAVVSLLASYVLLRENATDLYQILHSSSGTSSGAHGKSMPRLFCSLSIGLMLFSLARTFGTLATPSHMTCIFGAMGTELTCTIQGFVAQLGSFCASVATMTVVWMYTVMVCYNWTDARVLLWIQRIDVATWLASLAVAVSALPLQAYNQDFTPGSMSGVCWFREYPPNCQGEECTRGAGSEWYRIGVTFFPLWTGLIVCVVFFGMMYRQVRKIENRASHYAGSLSLQMATLEETTLDAPSMHSTNKLSELQPVANRAKSNAVAVQGMLYSMTYLAVVTCHTVSFLLGIPFLDVIAEVNVSLLGFWYFLIFVRPRTKMATLEGRWLRRVLMCCCCCCCCGNKKRATAPTSETAVSSATVRSSKTKQTRNGEDTTLEMRSSAFASSLELGLSSHRQQPQDGVITKDEEDDDEGRGLQ